MQDGGSMAAPALDRARRVALGVGVVGLGLGVVAALAWVGIERSLVSYLIGFFFWVGVALGCLALALLHQLSGGAWGLVIRRLLEAATRTLPLLAVLFLPLAFGVGEIYEWARPEVVAHDPVLQHKHAYLNVPFFLGRAAIYFLVWLGLSYLLNRWSAEQDRTGDPGVVSKLRTLSGPGLALYALTVTFASIDWVMSLDAHWFSTIFGVLTIGGQALGALSFVVALLVLLAHREPLAGVVRREHLHDLGKLMMAFVMLWAYFALSQFLVIWSGNLPEEIPWYLRRLGADWRWVSLSLALLQFALPFMLLLSADLKRRAGRLASVAVLVLVMRVVDTVWLIVPEVQNTAPRGGGFVVDALAVAGIGGLWVWFYLSTLRKRPLLPRHDPNWARAEAAVGSEP